MVLTCLTEEETKAKVEGWFGPPDPIQKAMSQRGVVVLSPGWLNIHHPELFPSVRTGERLLAQLKPVATGKFRLRGQRRPSKFMGDPAVLKRMFGVELVSVEVFEEQAAGNLTGIFPGGFDASKVGPANDAEMAKRFRAWLWGMAIPCGEQVSPTS